MLKLWVMYYDFVNQNTKVFLILLFVQIAKRNEFLINAFVYLLTELLHRSRPKWNGFTFLKTIDALAILYAAQKSSFVRSCSTFMAL